MKIGSPLPAQPVQQLVAGEVRQINLAQVSEGKTIIVLGFPGAFTPPCTEHHIPGYVANASAFKDKGVDGIYIVAPNDFFVVDAWSRTFDANSNVHFVADGSLGFTSAAGQELDLSGLGLGIRSQRYAAVVRDGKVVKFDVEPDATAVTVSGAEDVLKGL